MKKIAYIELDTHAEVAIQFYNSMNSSENYQVDYYFSEKILNQLGFKLSENIFLTDENKIFSQLRLKEYDFVLVGTVHRYFNTFYYIAQFFPMGFIAHNLNFIGLKKWQLFINVFKKEVLYRVKLLLKEGLFLLPKIRDNAMKVFVLDKAFADNELVYLPIYYTQSIENQLLKKQDAVLKVVIVGAVSQNKRDYKSVLEKLYKTTQNMQVVFLGKAEGEELSWLYEFDKNKPENLEIKYFTHRVSHSEFDKIMQESDILWAPIQLKTYFFSQTEVYGKTKMSGTLGDAIKYEKPILFSENYPIYYPFSSVENDHPIDVQLSQLMHKEFDFQQYYSKEKVHQELESVFKNWYKK